MTSSLKTQLLGLFIMALLILTPGHAQENWKSKKLYAQKNQTFMVSGILKKQGHDSVIKLAHSQQTAHSAAEATGAFTQEILNSYPGYTLMEVIVSPLQDTKCEIPI